MEYQIAQQFDTIDLLCWRHYGHTRGVVEAVIEANPRIADQQPILPAGLRVLMPEDPGTNDNPQQRLW